MSDETTLLPCPFCGGEDAQVRYMGGEWQEPSAFCSGYRGECWDCGALTRAYDTKAKAIAAWNNRAMSGMLTAEQVREVIYKHGVNDGSVYSVFKGSFKAIADELNVKLGSERDELKSMIIELSKKHPYTFNPDAPIDNLKTIERYIDELTAERDEWRVKAESDLHENPYVGLVRGKQWERTEISDYYCGRCGWKVTDHDSYCPECGGALHVGSSKREAAVER